jgi:type I restriction-modification system DNA methylase subunit
MKILPDVKIEGGLFNSDIIEQILIGDISGQKPEDFALGNRRNLIDEIASVFSDARALWNVFKHRREKLPESDIGTSATRDTWVVPFLGLLGYELQYNHKAYVVDGLTFAISHRAGEDEKSPPVHIVGFRQDLGKLPPTGRPRLAPHSLLQEYLNRTEQLWGIVTNGLTLRVLRSSLYVSKQAYIEFDLEKIFEEQHFEDFSLLFRLIHRTRLPKAGSKPDECFLEKYYLESIVQGSRVRDHLRDNVEECIKILANGFIAHPQNSKLRKRLYPDYPENDKLTAQDLYRDLLKLVYRFLFLIVSEDRGLISSNPLYLEHYGISRLRRLVDKLSPYNEFDDIWQSLRALWKILAKEEFANLLEVSPLNGDLFSEISLDIYTIKNRDLLEAFWHLFYYRENNSSPPRRVSFSALDVEELGSVYESLLDFHPQVDFSTDPPEFHLATGSERKSTGSYYTPPELVAELVSSALEPVINDKLRSCKTKDEKEEALLSIKVCDPASGSGHFLLAAARRLGKELARIRTGENEPSPEKLREAIRDVVAHCIYGVDKNPLAVELCKVALWLESHCKGKPLSFLDHRIRCGDSLVGLLNLDVRDLGIPNEAFTPVSLDNKQLASSLKNKNREERKGKRPLPPNFANDLSHIANQRNEIDNIRDDTPQQVREKQIKFDDYLNKTERQRTACNIWTYAFFQKFNPNEPTVTTDFLLTYMEGGAVDSKTLAKVNTVAQENKFFHWQLEFPEVFEQGGFDVVLGNPPWERIKLQEQEFFERRDSEIANALNASARKKLIKELPKKNPKLWEEYQEAMHTAESTSRFLRGSGQYPKTGRGDINTYSVFAERMSRLINPDGMAGIIVPTGIATDDTNKYFFADLIENNRVVSLFDFDNRAKLFPDVISLMKFCLLTISGTNKKNKSTEFSFFCHKTEDIRNSNKILYLTSNDIITINPNTRTLPIFRTRQDAELTKYVYSRIPILLNEKTGENPWQVRFLSMFHMSNDSHLFQTYSDLKNKGFKHIGNRFIKGDEIYLPLYEAKMIWHYDHRYGTYKGIDSRSNTQLPTPDESEHANPHFLVQPYYWVPKEEVETRLGNWKYKWFIGFRDITNTTNERTAIFCLFPQSAVGNNMPLMLINPYKMLLVCPLISNLTTLVFDFIVRQKLGGTHMNFFYVLQFPILSPNNYSSTDLRYILPRVLELVYTSWDIKPFADDIWNEADEALKQAIRKQWQENEAVTGGNLWELPDWIEAYPEIETERTKGIPLPPFKWDGERRALIKAELDAYYARLYGLTRKQLRYILDPADLTEKELNDILDPYEEVSDPPEPNGYNERCSKSTFPGETFRVLKDKEIKLYGEYRTRRLILEAWNKIQFGG